MKDEKDKQMVDLKARTKAFAVRIVRLFAVLPNSTESQVLDRQLLRSGTSVGAHYREGCRARSNLEFISKVEGGLAELEETTCWLELLAECGIVSDARLVELRQEADELISILVTCVKNAKLRNTKTSK